MTYDLNLIFHALADPTRRSIVARLSEQSLTVSAIAQPFQISLAAISKHLKVLEKARLIQRRKQGSYYYFSFNAEALQTTEQWLAQYQRFWSDQLNSLKHHLEQEESI